MKGRINVPLDEETIAMLKKIAAESHTTASQFMKSWVHMRMQESPVNPLRGEFISCAVFLRLHSM